MEKTYHLQYYADSYRKPCMIVNTDISQYDEDSIDMLETITHPKTGYKLIFFCEYPLYKMVKEIHFDDLTSAKNVADKVFLDLNEVLPFTRTGFDDDGKEDGYYSNDIPDEIENLPKLDKLGLNIDIDNDVYFCLIVDPKNIVYKLVYYPIEMFR